MNKPIVRLVEGDKVEISDGASLFPRSWVMSIPEADELIESINEALAEYDCQPDEDQLASCPWCDWIGTMDDAAAHMRPHVGATYPHRDSAPYREAMTDAGRGGLLR